MGLIIPFLNENVMQRKQNMDMSVSEYVIFENLSKEFALFKKKKKLNHSYSLRIFWACTSKRKQEILPFKKVYIGVPLTPKRL